MLLLCAVFIPKLSLYMNIILLLKLRVGPKNRKADKVNGYEHVNCPSLYKKLLRLRLIFNFKIGLN